MLKHDMGDVLRDGQIRNVAGEMREEKLWEEYSNSTLHERFFNFLVRLLADGMDDHAILHRLYGDQLSGKSFPNAAEVVWIVRAEPAGDGVVKIEIISSGYWLDALQRTKAYESSAYADEA